MGRNKKCLLAKAIEAGEISYNPRQLNKDIMSAIARDELLKANFAVYSMLYLHIIRMLALGHDSQKIVYSIKGQSPLDMSEERICFHISRVKTDYKDFVEIMEAIFHAKFSHFIDLGASEQKAGDCTNEWILSEFM